MALAEAVLNGADARLALAVLDGGPHVHARAVELAERVLADADAADGAEVAS